MKPKSNHISLREKLCSTLVTTVGQIKTLASSNLSPNAINRANFFREFSYRIFLDHIYYQLMSFISRWVLLQAQVTSVICGLTFTTKLYLFYILVLHSEFNDLEMKTSSGLKHLGRKIGKLTPVSDCRSSRLYQTTLEACTHVEKCMTCKCMWECWPCSYHSFVLIFLVFPELCFIIVVQFVTF